MAEHYVAAVDQGTNSTRCILFDRRGRLVSVAQREHKQHFPKPGWVEHDAAEIWRNVTRVVPAAIRQIGAQPEQVVAIGITNQRETSLLWDRRTGQPIGHAVVWQDTRTDRLVTELAGDVGPDRFADRCGLPLTTYFSAPRLRWMLDHTPACAPALSGVRCCSARWRAG
jgi:glycerol kinase